MEKQTLAFVSFSKKLTKADMKKVMGGGPYASYLIPVGSPYCLRCECYYTTVPSYVCRETNGMDSGENTCGHPNCVPSAGFLTCAECAA